MIELSSLAYYRLVSVTMVTLEKNQLAADEEGKAGSDLAPAFSAVGLYIHIPFCRSKCRYCDFNSYSGMDHLMPTYVQAVLKEIAAWSAIHRKHRLPAIDRRSDRIRVRTVYFGGGTPSLLTSDSVARVLGACREEFDLDEDAEVTLEANPGTLDREHLSGLLAAGINRLSIGAQSFSPRLLRLLGRTHTSTAITEAYEKAGEAGFTNINLDLIYAVPTQTVGEWRDDLLHALELRPTHLSLYGLSVEEGTALEALIRRGRIPSPDADVAADMYLLAEEMLGNEDYHHYEISNWGMSGFSCEHNLVYWRNLPYIGIGAGAHSSFCSLRLANVSDPSAYIAAMQRSQQTLMEDDAVAGLGSLLSSLGAAGSVAELDRATQMVESVILGLRLLEGLDEDGFRHRFGVSLAQAYGEKIEELLDVGLLERRERSLILTSRGRLLGNEVFVRFLGG